MKRLYRTLVAMTLGITLLTGCGNGQGNADANELPMESGGIGTEGQGNSDERITVTLGTVGQSRDGALKMAVEAYNRQDRKYVVEFMEYLPEDADHATTEASVDRFKMDLATGKGADIIDLSWGETDEWGYRGILANLNSFMTQEERQERYLSNILDAVQTDGALYEMGPSFSIWMIVGDSSRLGTENGWTLEEMLQSFEKNGKGSEALTGVWLGQSVAALLTTFSLDEFVDWGTGKADFCNERFYRILEFGSELDDKLTERIKPTRESIASGSHLANMDIALSVTNVQYMDWLFGGNMVFKGFPCSSGTGVAVRFYDAIGISAGSQCAEGAWDFLQYYVAGSWATDSPWMIGGFPLDRQAFEEALAQSMVQEYLNGEPIPKNINWDSEGPAIYAATEEEVARVKELVGLADRKFSDSSVIIGIIDEEVSGYNSGVLTAEQTAQKIQNRVQMYLDEQK